MLVAISGRVLLAGLLMVTGICGLAAADARIDHWESPVGMDDDAARPGTMVSGVVLHPDGNPAAGAEVFVLGQRGRVATESDGSFRLEIPGDAWSGGDRLSIAASLSRDGRHALVTRAIEGHAGGFVTLEPMHLGEPECVPGFEAGIFCAIGTMGQIYTIAAWDDGNGEAIYAGGAFAEIGCAEARYVAKWDGQTWTALLAPNGEGIVGGSGTSVEALAVYDDGTGPALFAAGRFSLAGDLSVNSVAKWDGSRWHALTGPSGAGISGTNPRAYALEVFDDGSGPKLYVGGHYSTAGGVVANNIATWDGSQWAPIPVAPLLGTNGAVRALKTIDLGDGPALYVGGDFTGAGSGIVNRIARWDGSNWSPLSGPSGTGIIGEGVHAIASYDDGSGKAIFVGGEFTTAGGLAAFRIARWDGAAWGPLIGANGNNGASRIVRSLAVYDDGTGDKLFIGGDFVFIDDNAVNKIVAWDGGNWQPLVSPSAVGIPAQSEAPIWTLTVADIGDGAKLHIGGTFLVSAGDVSINNLGRWDGSHWTNTAGGLSNPISSLVASMAIFDSGSGNELIVGGRITQAGSRLDVGHLARWNGTEWKPLAGTNGQGVFSPDVFPAVVPYVYALAEYTGPDGKHLYVAGDFTRAGDNVFVSGIARWDGTAWSKNALLGVGGVPDSIGRALINFDDGSGPMLYLGGSFTGIDIGASRIARWDGRVWSPIIDSTGANGVGLLSDDYVAAFAIFDDGSGPALYAGGKFATAGSTPANNIARWSGSDWIALEGPAGNGVDGPVAAMAVYDDGTGPALYVGGEFEAAGGITAGNIARWDGQRWAALSDPSGLGCNDIVHGLTVFDNGDGSKLYAAGRFTQAGAVPAKFFAAWNGKQWSALGPFSGAGGLESGRVIMAYDDGRDERLYLGGRFVELGGVPSRSIARLRPCTDTTPPCPGDLNDDGIVNATDLGILLSAFGLSDAGDLNDDGITNASDLGILLAIFGNSCP